MDNKYQLDSKDYIKETFLFDSTPQDELPDTAQNGVPGHHR
jgi:hypothetical protein